MLPSSASLFTSLPARPPTPPKDVQEHVQNALDFLENGHEETTPQETKYVAFDTPKRQLSIDTPPLSSPVPSHEVNGGANATKKVGFSPFPPTFHEVPQLGVSSSPRDRLLRSTPRPRNGKPIKSILKLSSFAPPPTPDEQDQKFGYFSPEEPGSFDKMLQSVLKELASPLRQSRLDAYQALHGALTAYDGIPDRQAMAASMPQFQQYLARDLVWRDVGGLNETQLATQAIKLACTFVFDSQLSKAMDDEFRTFLVDRSITVMEQADVPKALVKTHLYLMAQQRFHHSIITPSRADRMISALHTIEERCNGNSLIATRLVIYQKLLDQATSVMCHRMRDWLENVFHGMLSSINDTRTRAIEVGHHAGLLLGTNPAASKALHDLFETEVEEGQTYCDYLVMRLISMIGDKEKQLGVFVPQIWSAVVLFFRSKRRPLEKWPRLRTWLQVLQKCLNSSDAATKSHANLAWKKLVFTVMPDASTEAPMLSMLKVPITAGFEKRNSDKSGKQARQLALEGYHNLLHYAMRPSLSHADLDTTWNFYVDPILPEMIKASHKGRINASRILHGLLSPNAGLWNESAAMEPTAIQSHDLPRLDPRWVRSRLAKVLALVEPIISAQLNSPSEENPLATTLWQDTLQSIAEAGAQEVRTSNELREAIALVMNMFQRIWAICCGSGSNYTAATFGHFDKILQSTCHYIGPSLLAEDILARSPQGNAEAAPTPSHRPSKHQHALYSPLVFTLSMICSLPHQWEKPQWRSMAAEVIELACKSRATSAARLQLIGRTLQALETNCTSTGSRAQVAELWPLFAERATEALRHSKTESTPSGTLGQKLRDALSIVICGLRVMQSPPESVEAGHPLIEEVILVARCKAGDAGVTLAVVEPLSKALLDKDASVDLESKMAIVSILLRSAGWPQNRSAMDQGRKILWGVGIGPNKAGVFDPYEHLYTLTKDALRGSYVDCVSGSSDSCLLTPLVAAIFSFIERCPPAFVANTLQHLQEGLAVWFEDKDRIVSSQASPALAQEAGELWALILDQLTTVPRKDSTLIRLLEPLLIAGFAGPRRAVVNRTIVFWNESFGEQDTLKYPPQLEKVLRAARPYVELGLPNFPETLANEEAINLPAFSGPQDPDSQDDIVATASSRWIGLPQGTASPKKHSPASHNVSSHLASIQTGGTASAQTGSSHGHKARLRHDDLQVMFAPIDSSPLPSAEESQLLTDHQKEVRARQNDDAQMFPDLSSTPAKKIQKIPQALDFATDEREQDAIVGRPGTPTELNEAQNEMTGYLGSSPTPRSSEKFRTEQMQIADAEKDESDDEPSSSSPPGSPAQTGERESANHDDNDANIFADSAPRNTQRAVNTRSRSKVDPEGIKSDLPSDITLPAAQLQLEAQVAEDQANGDNANGDENGQIDATTVVEPTEISAQEDDVDVSRVENSFIELDAKDETADSASVNGSQQSTRSMRKRRRGSAASESDAAKKRKHQSPLRRVFSGLFGRSQENEDVTGDEIVVASSQPSDSPAAEKLETAEEVVQDTQNSVTTSQQQKRGRGRPRKSETPTPAPPVATPLAASTRSKRKASALNETEDVSSQDAASESKSTPAPKRQRRRARGKKATEEAQNPQADSGGQRPPSRREATAVVIEKPDVDMELGQTRELADEENSTQESQENVEKKPAAPSHNRPIATPKSMLGRLKDMLGDVKNALFGSQEERDFDDVLFELRREVHEAARRGRQT